MRGARSVGTWLSFAVLLATSAAINSLATISARAEVIGGRPSGCPHRYCGCASASYIGLPNKDGRWNLARNWLVFPRAAPGPGMAVVRGGHVAIIIGGQPGAWQLYDPNSGGGLSRIHVRPLFGAVVDPKGRRAATHAEPTKSNSIRANRPARRPVYAAREFSPAGH
jgi:hypothetical protein